ncbi:hypothetical protein HDU82_007339 [Entophlyctis luteolus]|nr:hypothetical protein HDU82_007339 [Entophlyctis luteolus]
MNPPPPKKKNYLYVCLTITLADAATTSIAPDTGKISVTASTTATGAEAAQAGNAGKATRLFAALTALNATKVSTDSLSLTQNYNYSASPAVLTGYTASMSVSFQIARVNDSGNAVDAVVRSGGVDSVDSVSFIASDSRSQEATAFATKGAINDAQAQASAVTSQLGLCIAGIKSINTNPQQAPAPVFPKFEAMADTVAAPSTPVQIGEISISASVDFVFILSPC